jgi:hypothetical protein
MVTAERHYARRHVVGVKTVGCHDVGGKAAAWRIRGHRWGSGVPTIDRLLDVKVCVSSPYVKGCTTTNFSIGSNPDGGDFSVAWGLEVPSGPCSARSDAISCACFPIYRPAFFQARWRGCMCVCGIISVGDEITCISRERP